MSLRGQKFYQDNPNLIYGSVRDDAPPMLTGVKLARLQAARIRTNLERLRQASHDNFNKEWNGMLGL